MKKIMLMLFVCSFTAALFAQEKSKLIRENDQVEAAQIVKIEKISKIEASNAATTVVSYDFTTGSDKYFGGAAGAKDLGGGVWGMIAGDANGSGAVDASDRSATWNERNSSGYYGSDLNLSGTVDASDRSKAWNNRNKTTSVPN